MQLKKGLFIWDEQDPGAHNSSHKLYITHTQTNAYTHIMPLI